MEEGRTYRNTGALRILFGLSVIDLVIIAGIFVVLIKVLPLTGFLNLTVSAATAWFGGQAIAKYRSQASIEAVVQYIMWLGQPDLFEPGPDTDARPLVYDLDGQDEEEV